MKKYLLPVSTAIGLLFDLLFWKKAPASPSRCSSVRCIRGMVIVENRRQITEADQLLAAGTILFFSAITVLRGTDDCFPGFFSLFSACYCCRFPG
jgi:hypothetical protein